MAVGQLLHLGARVRSPVLRSEGADAAHAVDVVGLLEHVLQPPQVLLPARHAVPVHHAAALGMEIGLEGPHGDLRVAVSRHRPLVDIGTTLDHVLIVDNDHLGMDIDHHAPCPQNGFLGRLRLGLLGGGWRARDLGLPLPQAEYIQVVPRMRLAPLELDGLGDNAVHGADGGGLPQQYLLDGPRIRDALWPHGDDDVGGKGLIAHDGLGHTQSDLQRDQLIADVGVRAIFPLSTAAQEVLVLDV
mmetsp:Transcript_9813/g.29514  ORF Transcript_9813/g.29514 Transcript_9813/m.29514 type:complete len:244 (+) Transcript_9813:2212-2943(+)